MSERAEALADHIAVLQARIAELERERDEVLNYVLPNDPKEGHAALMEELRAWDRHAEAKDKFVDQNRQLREALEPFAELARRIDGGTYQPDERPLREASYSDRIARPNIGDCRRARTVLSTPAPAECDRLDEIADWVDNLYPGMGDKIRANFGGKP